MLGFYLHSDLANYSVAYLYKAFIFCIASQKMLHIFCTVAQKSRVRADKKNTQSDL